MPLKKATGNMYTWVTHTWNATIGKCPHECDYCYVTAMTRRFPNMKFMYEGEPRLNAEDFVYVPVDQQKDSHQYHPVIRLGKNKKIFVAHTGDLFAEKVDPYVAFEILSLCNKHPENQYVLQTKNPLRYMTYINSGLIDKDKYELGTTIETNDAEMLRKHSKAPSPMDRAVAMRTLSDFGFKTFITIEPIMKFTNPAAFADLIQYAKPTFINIGADSKKTNLIEPSKDEMEKFISELQDRGIVIRIKENLERLRK